MGEVTKAKHLALNRWVAVKSLRPELSLNARFKKRFQEEAKSLAALQHPNVVSIYDFGLGENGQLYLVMEYVEGGSLRERLSASLQGIGAEIGLSIFRSICAGVAHAHKLGIVHRDIKPENILINALGEVKVVDFGLASSSRSNTSNPDTVLQQIVGTIKYMAPEQKVGNYVCNCQTDVYALGLVLYELLAGFVPEGAFEPLSKCSSSPAWLDSIVSKCLQRDPSKRFLDAGMLLAEIDRNISVELPRCELATTTRRSLYVLAAGTVLSGLGAYYAYKATTIAYKVLDLLENKSATPSVSSGSADILPLPSGNVHLSQTGRASFVFEIKSPSPARVSALRLRCESSASLSGIELAIEAAEGKWTNRPTKLGAHRKWNLDISADKFDPPIPTDRDINALRVTVTIELADPGQSNDMIISRLWVAR
jgi:serine/threonine protein kinase